jgi:hypothetical protein
LSIITFYLNYKTLYHDNLYLNLNILNPNRITLIIEDLYFLFTGKNRITRKKKKTLNLDNNILYLNLNRSGEEEKNT